MPFNKLDSTAIGKIRPRFKLESPESKELLMELVLNEAKKDPSIVYSSELQFIKLRCPAEMRHYWSPVLSLSFEWSEQDNKSYIRGVVGPNETIWTMFMFFYIGLAVIGTFGGMYSLVHWQISDDPSYLYIIPVTLFLFGSIFSTSKYGKRKAHVQTLHLLKFLRKAVDSVECTRVEM